MSQEGNTLSLYPSSASIFDPPHQTAMDVNTGGGGGSAQPQPYAALVPADHTDHDHHTSSDDDDGTGCPGSKSEGKSRRELPSGAVATLKSWLLSPEHFTHPYPTPQDQIMLMHKTGIDKKQLKNWFTNARRRIWKPMLKKQLEAGKLAAAAAGGTLSVTSGGGGSGLGVPQPDLSMSPQPYPQQQQQQEQSQATQEEMYSNFQRAQMQQGDSANQLQQEDQQYQQPYQQQQYHQQEQQGQYDQGTGQIQQQPIYDQYGNQVYDGGYKQLYQQQDNANLRLPSNGMNESENFPVSNSIGSLPPMNPSGSINSMYNMIKTDSHAVLMELFARDQDLVRQAASGKVGAYQAAAAAAAGQGQGNGSAHHTEGGAGLQASGQSSYGGASRWAAVNPPSSMGQKQHSVTFGGVPSLSSWPHFSSVSSLNNLGGLQGVKSITNLSAADLSSQGNLNKMGNLAQVKSIENMGRFDSFAFLEVFFDDKSGLGSNALGHGQRGVKRERDDDDAIGLSLDGDDGTSLGQFNNNKAPAPESGAQPQVPLSGDGIRNGDGSEIDGGTLKRAYDDALAARGLISVRQSSEKLTDLALPAKMQRTLSQEYIRQHNQGVPMADFFSTNLSAYAPNRINGLSQLQFHGQQQPVSDGACALATSSGVTIGDQNMVRTSVEVPSSTKCTLCSSVNVDTQLRPCGHMFHGRCLKPSLQNAIGPPKCPICSTPMQSAILAVPTAATDGGVPVA